MNETHGTTAMAIAPPQLEDPISTSHGWTDGVARMIGATRDGWLVLADISGFTAFVTATELEHGPPIIAALLEEVIRHIAPPLEIQDIEGDAVFAIGAHGAVVPPGALIGVLRGAFEGFRSLQRTMQADDSCTCNACRNVWRLRLKMIGHYGSFLRQTVGGRVQAAGRDVILAHRLLKNRVARDVDYLLFTEPALRYMDVDPGRAGLFPHTERYEHFGDVACFVSTISGGRRS